MLGSIFSSVSQWETDGRRWAGERRRQAEQMEALTAASAAAPAP